MPDHSDDNLRLFAAYGQLRLTARAWAKRESLPDWRFLDHALREIALDVAAPGLTGDDRDSARALLEAQPHG